MQSEFVFWLTASRADYSCATAFEFNETCRSSRLSRQGTLWNETRASIIGMNCCYVNAGGVQVDGALFG